jgi:hypothetical protein
MWRWAAPAFGSAQIASAATPATGRMVAFRWWKDQPKRDRSALGARYALVVSIETEAEGVDVWTPVALQIGVSVEVS